MRITESDLRSILNIINAKKGFIDPKYSEIGAYCLDYAYGGVSLHQYVNESGGVKDVFSCGHVPKRELYHRMCAFSQGMNA